VAAASVPAASRRSRAAPGRPDRAHASREPGWLRAGGGVARLSRCDSTCVRTRRALGASCPPGAGSSCAAGCPG